MKNFKAFFVAAVLMLGLSGFAQAQEASKDGLTWYTSLAEANTAATAQHKPLFTFFTGSDWCGWCRKLQRDVFAKPEFVAWAKKNVILVELDFPRNKQLAPELAQQNQSMQQALQVQGYPTIWLINLKAAEGGKNMEIERLGSLGYPSGAEPGKEEVKFLSSADDILKKGKK